MMEGYGSIALLTDPDPGGPKTCTDPTDPDPEHCLKMFTLNEYYLYITISYFNVHLTYD
jgi:hypothetical protein